MKFETEKQLAEFVRSLGGVLWLVGGSVRDELMGGTPHDKDFMVTGVNVADMPFDKVAGHDFPVFLVDVGGETCEVAMARTERKEGTGHKGFAFFTDATVTVEEDLARRDLTVNAMAKNVVTGEVCDPFSGDTDVVNGVLRHTTEAFAEDPLRVFRVARFAAKFDFRVAEATLALMRQLVPELSSLPAERVWQEMRKALNTQKPSRFFEVLQEVGALGTFFQELSALNVPDKHDGTAFAHTMRVMDAGADEMERFGLLVHDFGKGKTPQELHPAHHGHDKLGESEVVAFCERLRVPKSFQTFGMLCAREHMRMKRAEEMRHGKFVRWVLGLGTHFELVWRVSFVDSAFREGGSRVEELERFNRLFNRAGVVFQVEQDVTGKQLVAQGHKPGKHFGEVLFQRRVEAFRAQVAV